MERKEVNGVGKGGEGNTSSIQVRLILRGTVVSSGD